MGLYCSNCNNCNYFISEQQTEINNPNIQYGKKMGKKEKLLYNEKYKNALPTIIFLQLKIKKFLNDIKQDSYKRDRFYVTNYDNNQFANDNLDIISEKGDNDNDSYNSNNPGRHHKIKSSEKFRTLSNKYNSLNNNDKNISFEKNKPYKVEQYEISDSAKYTGYMLNGKQNGHGIQIWEDGARYEGEWKDGKFCGYGIFYHPNGDVYKGNWEDDKANGHGIYTSNDKVKYDGEWLNDCQDGYGEETWSDGAKYKGHYKEGKKCGVGEYSWIDGNKYIGNWNNNIQEGFGIYFWNNKRSYEGYFKNNSLHGEGHYKWSDGREYFGHFNEGKKQELGRYFWADGRSYTGFWEKGKQFGLGLYIDGKKQMNFGIWLNGKRNRWLTEEEVNDLKKEKDKYFEQIINFDIYKYQFVQEKELLKNKMNLDSFSF